MSYKTYNQTTANNSTKTPFCKVCYDAKRSDYNTHYLKDFKGPSPVVVCPYLLALKCNYCKNSGHTVSYCEVLKAKKEMETETADYDYHRAPSQNGNFIIMRNGEREQNMPLTTTIQKDLIPVQVKKNSIVAAARISNKFELLDSDEEDESESDVGVQSEETIAEIAAASGDGAATAMTWAKIVAAPVVKLTNQNIRASFKPKALQKPHQQPTTVTEAANWEKPYPKFQQEQPQAPQQQTNKLENYFTNISNKDWWEDSSDDDE